MEGTLKTHRNWRAFTLIELFPAGCNNTFCASTGKVWRVGAFLDCNSKPTDTSRAGPHLDGYNFLLADTHARWIRAEAAIDLAQFPEDTGRSLKVNHPRANPPCFNP